MASRNIVIKYNIRCFKSALKWSLEFSFLVLPGTSFLHIIGALGPVYTGGGPQVGEVTRVSI